MVICLEWGSLMLKGSIDEAQIVGYLVKPIQMNHLTDLLKRNSLIESS